MKKKEVKNYFREISIFMRVSMGKNIKTVSYTHLTLPTKA